MTEMITPLTDDDQEFMVLRTVYLPPELDEALRKLAYQSSVSKGALIRKALRAMMADDESTATITSADVASDDNDAGTPAVGGQVDAVEGFTNQL